jgi:FkbM family methyltransferase
MPGSWRLFLRRADIALRYYCDPLRRIWNWLLETDEVMNFVYDITPICKQYMISAIADVTGKSYVEVAYYCEELERDNLLQEHIRKHAHDCDNDLRGNPGKRYGRRIGWYAFARILKPAIVVEAGIAKGLGSCVLAAALMRNRDEGSPGRYYGTDIDPEAGYLFTGRYAEFGKIRYGDSIQSLAQLQGPVDLLVNDDDHSPDYERKEYQCVEEKLSEDAVILGGNAHNADCLQQFALRTRRQFVFVPEKPAKHWYPGAGIGVAFRRTPKQDDVFDVQETCSTERHGSADAGWTLCPSGLSENSIVYSLGVGEDISFDLSIIAQYGATVHAFDPTPQSITWLRQQSLPNEFTFHEVAVSDTDGTSSFHPPENPAHVSHSLLETDRGEGPSVPVSTKRLSTLMQQIEHASIDVLKMDIEGSEYAVIEDMLQSNVDVRQILVEFHHRFKNIGIEKTKEAIMSLRRHGYRLFAVSEDGQEYSFLLT